ncbi:MAG TPA: PAS domain-containing protein [Saprospiraceae bacterium]|nr:PAS domain-containing protein [Saprospiraceae bacterium]
MIYNKLLERQLHKHFGEEIIPDSFSDLFQTISASYDHNEQDRMLLERSIEISSEELIELNQSERKANEELQTLFDNIDEVFFAVSIPDFKLLLMSSACEKIYGYPLKEFQLNSKLWYELVLKEDKKIIDDNNQKMFAGESFTQEYRIHHKDGKTRWVETKITPTLDKENNLIRIDGVTTDITKRKKVEELLIESNENLKISVDRLNEAQQIGHLGSWILDIKSFTEIHTPEFYKIFESTQSEFATTVEDYLKYFHPEDRDKVQNTFNQALKTFQEYQYEARLLMKNGNVKNIIVHGKSILNERGELIKMHGTIQDITKQKKVELELEKNIAKLKKTNSELDKFVYSVSHDLRAPLSSILGIIEISQELCEDELMEEHLRMIENNIKKLDGFIADILDYSRNSREVVKNEEIDFKLLINETTHNLKYMGGKNRSINFKIDINEQVTAFSDKNCLKIIFSNLVSNAIRYQNIDAEDPFVEIKIETTAKNIDIIISDNGIGINKTFHNQVFDMFYRVSEGSVGSGLGLYIVKEAVNKLDGTIKIESELTKGSKFIIKLPNK